MPHRPILSAVVLALVLLAQGAFAFAPAAHHGMCGMDEGTEAVVSAADCGHPMGDRDAGCAQCSHCSGGHCVAWAVPVAMPSPAAAPAAVERSWVLPAHPHPRPPARLYRPPRLLV